ncbi:DTW domain-containing protein YfiP [Herbaspirillum sp. Sphag1AN]|uniref:tRNA-uridine aminocarboxypropyltransferase n=1 Tax=unclassified Herbaspirillum TaxID=2624150 RepID=UPI00160D0D4B|nr:MULTISPECIES: tRNA-uridine aminocarboxypropyltransferase [unclassified Herbaspirillum]MBB3212465.1 DTW domain-containing protein YfiP [Herbaspirillum sp. Sphag1AN]MBB3245436.1 DTW domain-containing protein YfiP [Herbaspirillum sp. Sphag64]
MPLTSSARRASCERCQRPQSACICQWICPVTPHHQVLVLQHPLEVKQAKGSGRLLQLSLQGSQLVVGEQFDVAQLQDLLFGVWPGADQPVERVQPVLLYPETGQTASPPVMVPAQQRLRLVILDATWRKSRKMLYLNPMLQQLPRLSLQNPPPSHYRIRKAHRPDQLSTLEASCHALAQLEQGQEKERYLPLLQAFDGFVGQQAAYASGSPD